jgi:hypothetical protein
MAGGSRFLAEQTKNHHSGESADEDLAVGDHLRNVFTVGKRIAAAGLIAVVQLIGQVACVVSMKDPPYRGLELPPPRRFHWKYRSPKCSVWYLGRRKLRLSSKPGYERALHLRRKKPSKNRRRPQSKPCF